VNKDEDEEEDSPGAVFRAAVHKWYLPGEAEKDNMPTRNREMPEERYDLSS